MTEFEALLKAVDVLGGQTAMAEELTRRIGKPIVQSHVYNWINRGKRLPERYALHVEAATRDAGECVRASSLCKVAFPSDRVA